MVLGYRRKKSNCDVVQCSALITPAVLAFLVVVVNCHANENERDPFLPNLARDSFLGFLCAFLDLRVLKVDIDVLDVDLDLCMWLL